MLNPPPYAQAFIIMIDFNLIIILIRLAIDFISIGILDIFFY